MISSPLVIAAPALGASPAAAGPAAQRLPQSPRRLPRRWSYGRGYAVIAVLAPIVLGSLLLVFLHHHLKLALISIRLQLKNMAVARLNGADSGL